MAAKYNTAVQIFFWVPLPISFGHRRTKMKADRFAIIDERINFLLTRLHHVVYFLRFHVIAMRII
jgi:hypothetical protein